MQLFYSPDIDGTNKIFTFSKDESRHIVKVLRKKEDDILLITDGKGFIYNVKIIDANDKKCNVEIIDAISKKAHNYKLHIAIAPTKMNDRIEWFLEKATEIGIDEITPIFCENSERKVIKKERFEKIIQSAMKQSLQARLPILNNPISFKEFIGNKYNGEKFIAHCDDQHKTQLKSLNTLSSDYTILIGPEGDFSRNEIELALNTNFIPVALGNNRLRTETAGIVACHTIALKHTEG